MENEEAFTEAAEEQYKIVQPINRRYGRRR